MIEIWFQNDEFCIKKRSGRSGIHIRDAIVMMDLGWNEMKYLNMKVLIWFNYKLYYNLFE